MIRLLKHIHLFLSHGFICETMSKPYFNDDVMQHKTIKIDLECEKYSNYLREIDKSPPTKKKSPEKSNFFFRIYNFLTYLPI